MTENAKSQMGPNSAGYRRPPVGVRFNKGQSGNPAGRPKGSKNRPPGTARAERLKSLMLEEAYRPIKVNQDGKEIEMPMAQAVLRSLAVAAVKGEARAQAIFIKMVSATEEDEAAIAEMIDQARAEQAAAKEPTESVYWIVDAVDGRPTGKTELIYPEDLHPHNDHPDPKAGKGR